MSKLSSIEIDGGHLCTLKMLDFCDDQNKSPSTRFNFLVIYEKKVTRQSKFGHIIGGDAIRGARKGSAVQ